jgi:predicted nucleic acid-binding protein
VTGPGTLRSGDALHLAVVERSGAQLASLDARFKAAAKLVGLPIFEIKT